MSYVLAFVVPILLAGFFLGAVVGVVVARRPSRSALWNALRGMLLGGVTIVLFFLFLPLILSVFSDSSGEWGGS